VYDPGTWQHVAVCKEKERLYVCWNGEIFSFDTSSYTFTPSPTNLFLGPRKYAFKDRMLFGDIRAFRVSSAALYTKPYAPPVRFEKDRATLADLDFKVKVDMKLIDLSGKDRHGQLNGVTWVAPPRR
jgi:hypothetical protein